MARPLPDAPLGVYLHIPFCLRLCPYCDFTVFVRREIPHKAYADALLSELRHRAPGYPNRHLRSIYFGGGTPGLLDPLEVGRLIAGVREIFQGDDPLEITLEVNPEQVTEEGMEALRAAGVNRLSFGVQSFKDATLKALGRRHSGAQARRALGIAREAGFERLSLDLIFAAPGQDLADFRSDLEAALDLGNVGHIALYQLTIEPRTVFGRQLARGRRAPPDDALGADCYELAESTLLAAGFEHYEVSAYGKPGHKSRHNGLYWTGAEYLGLGVGAHSLRFSPEGQVLRRANGRDLKAYLRGEEPLDEEEILPDSVHLGERLMVGLRTAQGVDLRVLQACLDVDVLGLVGGELRGLVERGWVIWEGDRVRPTPLGMRLGDRVGEALLQLP